jgi:hypothetical protein
VTLLANHCRLTLLSLGQSTQKECQVASGSALDINALLITPVQRVLRYPLLLKALVEVTDPSHPDYSHLQTAVEGAPLLSLRTMAHGRLTPFSPRSPSGIQKIADEINQSVEVSESTKAVHELAKQIPNIHVRTPFSPNIPSLLLLTKLG